MPPRPGCKECVLPDHYGTTNEIHDGFVRDAGMPQALNDVSPKVLDASNKRTTGALMNPVLISGVKRFPAVAMYFPNQYYTFPTNQFDTLLFAVGRTPPSVHDYYSEVSYGAVDIQGATYGWYSTVNNKAFYAAYPRQFAYEAALTFCGKGYDLSQYDNDGDGAIDVLILLHSGQGHETSGNSADIHSHSWQFSPPFQCGSYVFYNYVVQPEMAADSSLNGIGVFAHELGHAFGLPDLYDTGKSQPGEGIGIWSLMGTGSWGSNGVDYNYPSHLDCLSKAALGWLTPTDVTLDSAVSILDIEENKEQSCEYYLVENRQAVSSSTDKLLAQTGLLIYHIDPSVIAAESKTNTINCNTHAFGVAVEQSGASYDVYSRMPLFTYNPKGMPTIDDTWHTGSQTDFNAASVPSPKANDGTAMGVSVTGISGSGLTMQATISVGAPSISSDQYEPDDHPDYSAICTVNSCDWLHTIYPAGDIDFTIFDASDGITYTIETYRYTSDIDTVLVLSNGTSTLASNDDDSTTNVFSKIVYRSTATGSIYISSSAKSSSATGYYYLKVTAEGSCSPACVHGTCSYPSCVCESGWTGSTCNTAVCSVSCGDHGTCSSPNTCTCDVDWVTSTRCNCFVDPYESDDNSLNANLITVNTPQDHWACPVGDEDWVYFSATKGTDYRIETYGDVNLDTVIYLFNSTTQLEINDDYYYSYSFSAISWTCPATGTYWVAVTTYKEMYTGAYGLSIVDHDCSPACAHACVGPENCTCNSGWHGASCDCQYDAYEGLGYAPWLVLSETLSLTICPENEYDAFAIHLEPGINYIVETVQVGTVEVDTVLYLTNGTFAVYTYNDDKPDSTLSRLVLSVAVALDAFIVITPYSKVITGSYGLYFTTDTCSGSCVHGTCSSGSCVCYGYWEGPTCDTPKCDPLCEASSTCIEGNECVCKAGYEGTDCSTPICEPPCNSDNSLSCSDPNICSCISAEWTGPTCDTRLCDPACTGTAVCHDDGTCGCMAGHTGPNCCALDPWEPDESRSSAFSLPVSSPRRRTLCPSSDWDWMSFSAIGGESYTIIVNRSAVGVAGPPAVLVLQDSTGTQLATNSYADQPCLEYSPVSATTLYAGVHSQGFLLEGDYVIQITTAFSCPSYSESVSISESSTSAQVLKAHILQASAQVPKAHAPKAHIPKASAQVTASASAPVQVQLLAPVKRRVPVQVLGAQAKVRAQAQATVAQVKVQTQAQAQAQPRPVRARVQRVAPVHPQVQPHPIVRRTVVAQVPALALALAIVTPTARAQAPSIAQVGVPVKVKVKSTSLSYSLPSSRHPHLTSLATEFLVQKTRFFLKLMDPTLECCSELTHSIEDIESLLVLLVDGTAANFTATGGGGTATSTSTDELVCRRLRAAHVHIASNRTRWLTLVDLGKRLWVAEKLAGLAVLISAAVWPEDSPGDDREVTGRWVICSDTTTSPSPSCSSAGVNPNVNEASVSVSVSVSEDVSASSKADGDKNGGSYGDGVECVRRPRLRAPSGWMFTRSYWKRKESARDLRLAAILAEAVQCLAVVCTFGGREEMACLEALAREHMHHHPRILISLQSSLWKIAFTNSVRTAADAARDDSCHQSGDVIAQVIPLVENLSILCRLVAESSERATESLLCQSGGFGRQRLCTALDIAHGLLNCWRGREYPCVFSVGESMQWRLAEVLMICLQTGTELDKAAEVLEEALYFSLKMPVLFSAVIDTTLKLLADGNALQRAALKYIFLSLSEVAGLAEISEKLVSTLLWVIVEEPVKDCNDEAVLCLRNINLASLLAAHAVPQLLDDDTIVRLITWAFQRVWYGSCYGTVTVSLAKKGPGKLFERLQDQTVHSLLTVIHATLRGDIGGCPRYQVLSVMSSLIHHPAASVYPGAEELLTSILQSKDYFQTHFSVDFLEDYTECICYLNILPQPRVLALLPLLRDFLHRLPEIIQPLFIIYSLNFTTKRNQSITWIEEMVLSESLGSKENIFKYAIMHGCVPVVKLLLSPLGRMSANCTVLSSGYHNEITRVSAIEYTLESNSQNAPEILSLLLSHPESDPNFQTKRSFGESTPLCIALKDCEPKCIEMLLSAGADLAKNPTALKLAVLRGIPANIKLLFQYGAKPQENSSLLYMALDSDTWNRLNIADIIWRHGYVLSMADYEKLKSKAQSNWVKYTVAANWSPQCHSQFSRHFKKILKTVLLCWLHQCENLQVGGDREYPLALIPCQTMHLKTPLSRVP
ncbi:immune inhibitor A precursor [Pelomyxa schiedti]|nr:immune inhibitor A precursor [Pelomyxa schiedti]